MSQPGIISHCLIAPFHYLPLSPSLSRFQWFVGGGKDKHKEKELGPDNDLGISLTAVDEFTSSLSFPRLQTTHSGNYTCVASNAAANDQHSANLAVNSESISLSAAVFLIQPYLNQ